MSIAIRRDGFLVIEGVRRLIEACAALKQRAVEIVEAWEPTAERTVFTTDQQERTSNREFLESGSSIWCFFEADAFDESGELGQDKTLSINKIGHAMHDLDPVFESFSYTPELADVATDIGMGDPLAIQSMYIFKQPHIGGEVELPPGRHVPVHRAAERRRLLVRHRGRHARERVPVGPAGRAPRSAAAALRAGRDDERRRHAVRAARRHAAAGTAGGLVPIEAAAGTLVVLDGLLPHWSDVNRSATSRHAYSLHCIEGAARYPASNWLQRPASMPLRSLQRIAAT